MKPKQFIIPLFCSFFYLCSTVQSAEYVEVNQTPEEGCRYVEGEVIVKFKDNSAVHISRRAKGQFATADVGTVDATFGDFQYGVANTNTTTSFVIDGKYDIQDNCVIGWFKVDSE